MLLVPDKQSYQPGDVAKILVQAPFTPAEGLLTVSRSGILYTERFALENGSTTLEVPIEEAYLPNVNIQVDVDRLGPAPGRQGPAAGGRAAATGLRHGQPDAQHPAGEPRR